MDATPISIPRSLRVVNLALLLLAAALMVAAACTEAAPTVDRATLWMDTVKHGEFVQQVRGAGSLEETDSGDLKAVLRIPEARTFDLEAGLRSTVEVGDTMVEGVLATLDSEIRDGTLAVEVQLTGELPSGVRPGLSIDGRIDIRTFTDVLYVAKPAYAHSNSQMGLFRLVDGGGFAERVAVQLGPSSVNLIQVIDGLDEGDEIILSDMSRFDVVDRVRLR